jgi:hypothetical protein
VDVRATAKVRPKWSVARMMSGIAVLAVGLAVLLALRPAPLVGDGLIGILCFVMAAVLTVATDRALFTRSHRVFWFGFAATAWFCAALFLTYFLETRRYLLDYGPPLVRAREDLRRQIANAHMAQVRGMPLVSPPRVSEWYLLASALTETAIGLSLGIVAASVGGFLFAGVAGLASRIGSLAQRLGLPNPTISGGRTG